MFREFQRGEQKNFHPSKSSYFFMVMQRNVWSIIAGQQVDTTTLQSNNSMHRWSPLQWRGNNICWRIVKYMLWNCSEMLFLGTYWTTWYSMVSKQAHTIHHKMDQTLWQTPESIDFIHSLYVRIQTTLSCGVLRLWFRWRSWRFEIHFWRIIVRPFGSHTSVSHNSTESCFTFLDTGLSALELWELIVSVLGNVSRVSDGSGQPDNDVNGENKHHKSHKQNRCHAKHWCCSFKCPIRAKKL